MQVLALLMHSNSALRALFVVMATLLGLAVCTSNTAGAQGLKQARVSAASKAQKIPLPVPRGQRDNATVPVTDRRNVPRTSDLPPIPIVGSPEWLSEQAKADQEEQRIKEIISNICRC